MLISGVHTTDPGMAWAARPIGLLAYPFGLGIRPLTVLKRFFAGLPKEAPN